MHKMFQKRPFYKGFKTRIVKEEGYKLDEYKEVILR